MKNLSTLQSLAAGMTAAQPARIERNLETNDAIVNGDVLFQQYLANRTMDDATGSYGTPGATGMALPMVSGPAALAPHEVPTLTFRRYCVAADGASGQTYSGAWVIFASATYNHTHRNVYLALACSAGWGDCTPWGTDVFRQQASAAWGSSAARDAGAPTFRIARLTPRILFRNPQARWPTARSDA
jgi:hypothetical protein